LGIVLVLLFPEIRLRRQLSKEILNVLMRQWQLRLWWLWFWWWGWFWLKQGYASQPGNCLLVDIFHTLMPANKRGKVHGWHVCYQILP
jgi:hypothetical protein